MERQFNPPIPLTEGHKPAWAKEGEDAWVRRLLGIVPGEQAELLSIFGIWAQIRVSGDIRFPVLGYPRLIALNAWVTNALEHRQEDTSTGCAIALVDVPLRRVLLQRKDEGYPTVAGRGRYSLFGGFAWAGESWKETVLREWYEEVRVLRLADAVARRLTYHGLARLPLVQREGDYKAIFVTMTARDPHEFEQWSSDLCAPDALAEATFARLEGDDLLCKIEEDAQKPGRWFIASHGELLRRLFTQNE